MTYPLYRTGTIAVVDGVSYPVSYAAGENYVHFPQVSDARPAPFPRQELAGAVPVEMCERVFSVQVYASYRDHRVMVDAAFDNGTARVLDAEWDNEWATINGFVQENSYEYYKTVDMRDLRDYAERQNDLLFTRWRAARFARPVEGIPLHGGWPNGQAAVVAGRPRSGVLETEGGRVAEVSTRAEYLGYSCEVAGITMDGSVGVHYLGSDFERADADGFRPGPDGRWSKTVHIFDLARYHELHRDLLFDQWRESRDSLAR
ncbi:MULTISPECIES: hypothetical protein [Amycolatopsis]|uniref:Uncharacterized protein n=1 Tax=Amycolatopsis thermalba TaxID=944492 RepID=A0ABY4NR88_9PSEU|nr:MULTISPECIES: hypothetical protein [Amycolatopsis]OXM74415.1 hypothetical protein CF166_05450 [Amycolatopsis sp. KNN50.9b]UQS21976.1 hypothetical protein L1857_03625 [Amycolatopsis thermalba]